jgi:hypothetical protein
MPSANQADSALTGRAAGVVVDIEMDLRPVTEKQQA